MATTTKKYVFVAYISEEIFGRVLNELEVD